MTPSGKPMTIDADATVVACQTTVAAICLRVNPRALRRPKSRRRWWTLEPRL
jgi:hypothetical protein